MRVIGTIRALTLGLALVVPLACSRQSDQESLRDGLSRLPEESQEVPQPEPAPVELPVPMPGPVALPDTAGLPSSSAASDPAPDGVPLEPPVDTTPTPLQPGPPRDTRPWIPNTPPLPAAGWTIEPTDVDGGNRTALLSGVRAARNDEFDRVVFQFDGTRLPGYHLEYLAETARDCGSGRRMPVAGGARLLLRLSPAAAHTEEGASTVQRRVETDLPHVREIRAICDFEGQVGWVLGLDRVRPYRVTVLRNPARVVVDVR